MDMRADGVGRPTPWDTMGGNLQTLAFGCHRPPPVKIVPVHMEACKLAKATIFHWLHALQVILSHHYQYTPLGYILCNSPFSIGA